MVYFLCSWPITRSMWMRTLAIPLVRSTSTGSSCDFLLVNAGIVNFACLSTTLSEIVKPLSAMTISPGTKNSKKPQLSAGTCQRSFLPKPPTQRKCFLGAWFRSEPWQCYGAYMMKMSELLQVNYMDVQWTLQSSQWQLLPSCQKHTGSTLA